jgi:hypothetical protein
VLALDVAQHADGISHALDEVMVTLPRYQSSLC